MKLEYIRKENKKIFLIFTIISLFILAGFTYLGANSDITQRRMAYYFVAGLMAFSSYINLKKMITREYYITIAENTVDIYLPEKTGSYIWQNIRKFIIVGEKNPSIKINFSDGESLIIAGQLISMDKEEIISFIKNKLKNDYPQTEFYNEAERI